MTARALVLAALSPGSSTLRAPLRARDTELMAAGLRRMGTHVSTVDDNLWVLRSRPLAGPAHVDVGLAGTVMRFLPPVAGLEDGSITFDGDPAARLRPMAPLITALQTLGVRIDAAPGGGLPLSGPNFDRGVVVRHVGPPVPSAPHLNMTVQMLRAAGAGVDDSTPNVWAVEHSRLSGRGWDIEPDLSGAAPFLAAALVTGGTVTVQGWPRSTTQPGDRLRGILREMGGAPTLTPDGLVMRGSGQVHGLRADLSAVSELTPVIAGLAAVADSPSHLYGIGHIRGHET